MQTLLVDLLLALLALFGHAALWITLVNNVHATMMPRPLIKYISHVALALCVGLPLYFTWWYALHGTTDSSWTTWASLPAPLLVYGTCTALIGAGPASWWLVQRLTARPPAALRSERGTRHNIVEQLGYKPLAGSRAAQFIAHLPGNDIFNLEVTEKVIEHPRLPPQLHGLSIAHLTDLHFVGTIGRAYYDEVVRLANDLDVDFVAVTGDLVDEAEYIDWIPETLGRLESRHGTFVVLGNHDLKVKHHLGRLRQTIDDAGLIYLGGRSQVLTCGEGEILLAGNELPWFAPAADPRSFPAESTAGRRFRLLLSHSPDQYAWARRHDFDLMLAGHNHGGQFRLPVIGPILAPSHYGVRYASGVFHEPPTVLHVARGISAQQPARFNCSPEITRLVLHCAASHVPSAAVDATERHPALADRV
ncbi:MAG: metallophosphoesterase [Pirellulales bacterium]|nr:metallophosphoesterase [Pirellulales bacterium]